VSESNVYSLLARKLLHLVSLSVALFLLAACVHAPEKKPGLRFNSVEVLNLTQYDIFDMQIEVTRLHRKFSCGIILHRSICMNGFHTRALEGNEIVITWEQRGQKHYTGPLKAEAPANYNENDIYAVQFVFTSPEHVEIRFAPSRY